MNTDVIVEAGIVSDTIVMTWEQGKICSEDNTFLVILESVLFDNVI